LVIRNHKSKDKQYNGQMKEDKKTNNDIPSIAQKNNEWATQTRQKTGDELSCYGMVSSPYSTSYIRRVSLETM
jgi:hypothetical protein